MPIRPDIAMGQEGPSGFTVCGECEDGWVYPAPHGVDATDCPAFYDICRCEGTPCPSCRGSGLVPTDELRQAATDAARSMWGLPCRPADLADAVLRVVTEHLRKELAVSDRDDIRRLARILDKFMVGMLNSLTGIISTLPDSLQVQVLDELIIAEQAVVEAITLARVPRRSGGPQ